MSELLTRSSPDIAHEEVFARLIERERLGCTCLGDGVAFPHCRISGLKTSCGALLKLSEPIDFDAADGARVDLVFGLMVPEELESDHLADIEVMAGLLRERSLCARLRAAASSQELGEVLLARELAPAARLKSARRA